MKVRLDGDQLVRDLVQLRRAQAELGHPGALAGVRAHLERALGRSVTRAMAARTLGVSHTALDKWIERGEISTVLAPSGRHRVPLRELVELADEVDERSSGSPDDPYPLATMLRRRRDALSGIDPEQVLPRRYRRGERLGHRQAELRSLAYHRAVAQRLDPRLVADARARLHEWRDQGKIDERYAAQWEKLLSRPISSIARTISVDRQSSRDLRQSSPLTGVLSEPERRRISEIAS